MCDGNETTRFVTGNKAGNLYGTFNKYAWEIENEPRYVIHEAVRSGSGFTLLIMIAIGIGGWFVSFEEAQVQPDSYVVSNAVDDDSATENSQKWTLVSTIHNGINWLSESPVRCVLILMVGVVLVFYIRIRKWKKKYLETDRQLMNIMNYCDWHGLHEIK